MSAFDRFLLDRNGDGFIDDADARIIVAPAEGVDSAQFWPALIDTAALLGLRAQALPLPLFVSAPPEDELDAVWIRRPEDIQELSAPFEAREPAAEASGVAQTRSMDMLDLFTTSGLLSDLDGDLVPDATRFGLALPAVMPHGLGVALCNFAVRIGLESGGVRLPLVSDETPALTVQIGEGAARLKAVEGGWEVAGEARSLAALIDAVAQEWPAFGLPEGAGARAGVEALAAVIGAAGPPASAEAPLLWELQWAAQPELTRLDAAIERSVVSRLSAESRLELTVFACEALPARRRLERDWRLRFEALGVTTPRIRVLSAFKAGLSWLTEVVLPELAGVNVARLEIAYRRFAAPEGREHLDMPIRWLQELFPGDEIAADRLALHVEDIELIEDPALDAPTYRARALDAAGRTVGAWELELISYALPFMPGVDGSGYVEVTTGGLIATVDGERIVERVDTDLDRFWSFWQREVMSRVADDIESGGGFRADRQPFFGALEVELWLSAPNSRLGVREENDSAAEALHEDIYFNTLDMLEELGLRRSGGRTSAPGAVIPVVHVREGSAPHAIVKLWAPPPARPRPPRITVEELRFEDGRLLASLHVEPDAVPSKAIASMRQTFSAGARSEATFVAELNVGGEPLPLHLPLPRTLAGNQADAAPPMDANIYGAAVEQWAGEVARADAVSAWIEGRSYQGRLIPALALRTPAPGRVWSPAKLAALKPTVLIVARHHANEISSTNAALRLAHLVGIDPEWTALIERLNIVVIPHENADGAALHARLSGSSDAATWKHHPARYNALGHEFGEDYFNPDTAFGEARVRPALWHRWLPDALVDNHGVPSHEWVQPFAGFGSPPRFRVSYWIPQALIYGIARYVDEPEFPEHREAAEALRDAVSAALRETEIGDLNRAIGASYRRWGQERVPERFPGEFHDDMLWHFGGTAADPEGRGFNVRYPRTTVLSWVTEVNDETATGAHLEMVANAHLRANRAMLDVLCGLDASTERSLFELEDGRRLYQYKRRRPLRAR